MINYRLKINRWMSRYKSGACNTSGHVDDLIGLCSLTKKQMLENKFMLKKQKYNPRLKELKRNDLIMISLQMVKFIDENYSLYIYIKDYKSPDINEPIFNNIQDVIKQISYIPPEFEKRYDIDVPRRHIPVSLFGLSDDFDSYMMIWKPDDERVYRRTIVINKNVKK